MENGTPVSKRTRKQMNRQHQTKNSQAVKSSESTPTNSPVQKKIDLSDKDELTNSKIIEDDVFVDESKTINTAKGIYLFLKI
jgi:hypothetical protein